ncbi:response regulator transcription factor [Deinococcus sp. Arct2-2]|uniref:response regulator n=1 Tax=Deinococcus sp. Arct2-2 TaxID=2568653 RepID=UPI0010A4442E|nr:response regulator transcription factor [Deinococcus sp. Arct2-2]THF70191.1 response regulator transcription factor [Deinococcus sp. Arct2-2]
MRLLLADDQTLVRQGLARLLSLDSGIEVVGEAATGRETLELTRFLQPDVLLLDVRMPQLGGLEVLQALRAEGNAVAVVLLSTFSEAAAALAGLRLGAYSYLLKDVEFAVLTETLHAAVKGDRTIHSALPRHFLPVDQANPQPELTLRELEVLRLMAGGHSNKQVARALHLQEGTVKNHVSSLLSKLERQDRLQAVLRALDLGLL